MKLKTTEQVANELMAVIEEWRPSESEWTAVKIIITEAQLIAFKTGRNWGVRESEDLFNECAASGKDFIAEILLTKLTTPNP